MLSVIKMLFLSVLLISQIHNAYGQVDRPIHVVTSFSILEDLVVELGGSRVTITNLVDRNRDAHMYQPKPSDAIAISKADLIVINGLGFEGWMTRLMHNNNYRNALLIASEGVTVLKHGDEIDPHAWQSLDNIRIYSENITKALSALKPEHTTEFNQRQTEFTHKILALQLDLHLQMNAINSKDRVVVTSHDAFSYLGKEFGIQFFAPIGLSTESDATASDVAAIIQHIRRYTVNALFVENINNPRLLQQISAETGVAIGGRLYSDALGDVEGPAANYLGMMRHNIESLINALQPD